MVLYTSAEDSPFWAAFNHFLASRTWELVSDSLERPVLYESQVIRSKLTDSRIAHKARFWRSCTPSVRGVRPSRAYQSGPPYLSTKASSHQTTAGILPAAMPNTASDPNDTRLSASSKEQLLEGPFAVVPYPRDSQNSSAHYSRKFLIHTGQSDAWAPPALVQGPFMS